MAASDSENLTVEVTPAMKEAGVAELLESFRLCGDLDELVTQIFISMVWQAPALSQLLLRSTEAPTEQQSGA
jgi:hypothetical protein